MKDENKITKYTDWLTTTNALLQLFNKKSSRKEYLDSIVELICSWSDCRCVGIRLLNEDGNIPYESYVGYSEEFWKSENFLSVKVDQCACIRVVTGKPEPQDLLFMTRGGSFRCNNFIEVFNGLSEEERSRFRGMCVCSGFSSVAIVPLSYRGKLIGAVHMADEREGMVPLQAIEFIESVTPLIGEAVNRFNLEDELKKSNEQLQQEINERKQMESALRSLTAELSIIEERERRRIATDIHDYIGQPLAVAKIKLGLLAQALSSPVFSGKTEEIRMFLEEAIKYSRSLTFELSPPVLYEFGFEAAVEWMCEQFYERYGIQFTFEDDRQLKPMDDEIRVILFKAVRELLINNVKHAKAKLVRVSLQNSGEKIRVLVEDDGIGFDTSITVNSNKNSGFGLFSIRERLRYLGGNMMVESKPGHGARITLEVPIKS